MKKKRPAKNVVHVVHARDMRRMGYDKAIEVVRRLQTVGFGRPAITEALLLLARERESATA